MPQTKENWRKYLLCVPTSDALELRWISVPTCEGTVVEQVWDVAVVLEIDHPEEV